MGRYLTDVAAFFANADNLPPKEGLPDVSLWDAFLPKHCVDRTPTQTKPLDPKVGMRVYREFYDVKKDKDGKKLMVAHKNGNEISKAGIMTEDVKKNGNGGNGGESKKGDSSGSKKGDAHGNAGGEKKDNAGGVGQKPADAEWTTEEDEKLKAMKAENKTWKEITAELGRSKNMLQARFKEIRDTGDGNAGAQKGNNANKKDGGDKRDKSGDGKGDDKKKGQQDKSADKKSEKKAEDSRPAKAPSKAPSKAGSGEARFTMGEWRTLQEDDLFSFGELQCLSELIMRDERQRWLRIASAFADTTGRRVHPDDIMEKFEQIGMMG